MRFKIFGISLISIVLYLIAGTAYHDRAVNCYEIKHSLDKNQYHSGDPNGAVGSFFDTISWPLYLYGDAVNKLGIFDCKPHAVTIAENSPDKTYSLVRSKIETGEQIKYINSFQFDNVSNDILPGQLGNGLALDSLLFVFIMQPNDWNNIPLGKENMPLEDVKWAGVLVSIDSGQNWQKYYTINNPVGDIMENIKGTIPVNPVGMFVSNKVLYLDIADDRGAGSGEGALTRMQTTDGGKTWQKQGCYYFGENRDEYYLFEGDRILSVKNPKLKAYSGCIY